MNNILIYLDEMLRKTYQFFACISAFFLLFILITVIVQVVSRWGHFDILGAGEYAGYFMSVSAFLMAPQALLFGSHIRMDLFLSRATGGRKKFIMVLCLSIANAVSVYIAYYAVKFVQVSHMLGDRSQGMDATPLWIPQLGMAIGMVLFAIAMIHFTILYVACGDLTLEKSSGEA